MKNKFIHLFLFFLFIFNSIFATVGINIYSIKDNKVFILLGKDSGGFSDFTGKIEAKDKGDIANAASRETHEETMGVFLNPIDDDPKPEVDVNIESGIKWFKERLYDKYKVDCNIPKPSPAKPQRHTTWFVMVDFIEAQHFNDVLKKLKTRIIEYSYVEKTEYKWVEASDLLTENKKIETLGLRDIFKRMVVQPNIQAMIKKIIDANKGTEKILEPGTYVVKNLCSPANMKDVAASYWIYDPSIMPGVANNLHFDAVLVSIEPVNDTPKFTIESKGVFRNFEYFNYYFREENKGILPRGVFTWDSDFGLTNEGKRGWVNEARLGTTSYIYMYTSRETLKHFFDSYQEAPEAVDKSKTAIKTDVQIDVSKYPEHPFNFKVRKIDEKNIEIGPEYLVDFNKQKPEIISVIEVVEPFPAPQPQTGPQQGPAPKPQPQPQALLQLQGKLAQLKNNLLALKVKLGALSGKLAALKGKLGGSKVSGVANPLVTKDIVIDGKKYCTCEFWNLPLLEAKVKSMGDVNIGINPGFNVIFAQNLNVADFMKKSENNGAVFQIAANDDLAYTWISGGVQAGAVVTSTVLGNKARATFSEDGFNDFFKDLLLPNNSQGHVSLGTLEKFAGDINKILLAIHSGLEVQGVPGQTVHVPFVAAYNSGDTPPKNTNCLQVAYDGTLLAAVKLNAQKVFLTFMGGKVFASSNPPGKIIAAIKNAVTTYVQKYGLNVTLLYPITGATPDSGKAGPLTEIVKSVGGYVEIGGVLTNYEKSV